MTLGQFFLHTEAGHFILYLAAIAVVGGMPAPTATSGVMYKWAFASLNSFAMNFQRAFGSKVESSPNFQNAVNNLPGPVNKPVIIVEAPTEKP